MSESIRILLVEDHAVLRRGVRQLLSESLPGADFGEAEPDRTRALSPGLLVVV